MCAFLNIANIILVGYRCIARDKLFPSAIIRGDDGYFFLLPKRKQLQESEDRCTALVVGLLGRAKTKHNMNHNHQSAVNVAKLNFSANVCDLQQSVETPNLLHKLAVQAHVFGLPCVIC